MSSIIRSVLNNVYQQSPISLYVNRSWLFVSHLPLRRWCRDSTAGSCKSLYLSATTKMATPTIHFSKKSSEGSRNKSMSGHSESYLFCIPVQWLCTYKILDASIQVLSLKSGHHEMVQKLPPSMQIHERRLMIQYPIQCRIELYALERFDEGYRSAD